MANIQSWFGQSSSSLNFLDNHTWIWYGTLFLWLRQLCWTWCHCAHLEFHLLYRKFQISFLETHSMDVLVAVDGILWLLPHWWQNSPSSCHSSLQETLCYIQVGKKELFFDFSIISENISIINNRKIIAVMPNTFNMGTRHKILLGEQLRYKCTVVWPGFVYNWNDSGGGFHRVIIDSFLFGQWILGKEIHILTANICKISTENEGYLYLCDCFFCSRLWVQWWQVSFLRFSSLSSYQ